VQHHQSIPAGQRAPANATARPLVDTHVKTTAPSIVVWDLFVRIFHWSTVALVLGLVVTAHTGKQEIHMFLGFSLTLLVLARLVWGFNGTAYARFSNFVTSPVAALRYLRDIATGHPARFLGHNPAGGWMVIALLAALSVLLTSGLILQATLEFDGPLVELLAGVTDQQVRLIVAIHESAMNVLYLLIPLHLIGVVLAGRQHKENLVAAMITGSKPTQTER